MIARPICCGQCGAAVMPREKFCGACGHGRSVEETVSIPAPVALDEVQPARTGRSGGLAWLIVAAAVVLVGGGVLATVLLTRDEGQPDSASPATAPPVVEDVPIPDPEPTRTVPPSASGAGSSVIGTSTSGCEPAGTNNRAIPVVDCVSVRADSSGLLNVSASYCDRTPGSINRFKYVFELLRSSGGPLVAAATVARSQRRACNTVAATLPGPYPADDYVVRLTVQNLTNGVDGLGQSKTFRVE